MALELRRTVDENPTSCFKIVAVVVCIDAEPQASRGVARVRRGGALGLMLKILQSHLSLLEVPFILVILLVFGVSARTEFKPLLDSHQATH